MTRPAAIVTGGARGIGLACAEALADAGFDILVADLADQAPANLAANITARAAKFAYIRCDIANLESHADLVDIAMRAFGRIDCLVNNAGIGAVVRGDLLDLKPDNFDRALGINLRGTVFLSQAVAKAMLRQPGDHAKSIITITSVSAEMASPERSEYCMSKAGLSMWVKNLALRLASENIGVFELRPGIIRTDMTAGVTAKYDALIEGGLVPAKRWGEASDIGAMVAALAASRLGFSTGSIINVDGALSVPRL
ncbi:MULTISPECIES: 3-ketoacyl-ACP reductase [unclassified Mesorhizobium]|uniref:3-ketoacyl-ACP reductase n=1 Tax=unclassified Mesorhizobium TaxID=325217 RepID=UPI000FCA450D|nr:MULTISPECIES: 3-ketoacyl-ACP reductase [unclassified Mesorhizobium]TGR48691.1 3-ketoacyl-ACP reductase [bacterium M00.F.Ca.ET.199.01.1.1]TGU37732.1 3-ketoacyl-ACP reductase [bacterium M00.F.Ca.ET.156.01.1.1]TGV88851.1 3-ketoacyl-ACP reductase [Mesorhizobium sp. M00.F.Ca.ET.149.01.1.1]RUW48454.1 3-ketoacyl-ACP reductase [Mesorhizobium sp. M8A.F.Ca.ET.021.01.1.1]RWC91300.1 MAG: 3-ketoacyl-ACP reductase [Mesorhizobium sp.]